MEQVQTDQVLYLEVFTMQQKHILEQQQEEMLCNIQMILEAIMLQK
jgi:hypothetical protein